ncbi:MAG: zinc-ribbon domain-containing protein [bacterium]
MTESLSPSFCTQCGAALPPEAKFCPQCGRQIVSSTLPASSDTSEILELLRQGKMIEAIKRDRLKTGRGLKESKEAVEALARQHQISPSAARSAGSSVGSGCFLWLGSLFIGFMIATAGLALFPKLGTVTSPLICEKTVQIHSQSYSYQAGQRGVTRDFYCEDIPGERRSVNAKVIVFSILLYSVAAFLLLSGYRLIRRIFR